MTTTLQAALNILALISGITALVLYFVVLSKHLTEAHPWPHMTMKYWGRPGKKRSWYTPRGFKLRNTSLILFGVAILSANASRWLF